MKNKYDNKSMAISGEFQFKGIAGKSNFSIEKKRAQCQKTILSFIFYMMITSKFLFPEWNYTIKIHVIQYAFSFSMKNCDKFCVSIM